MDQKRTTNIAEPLDPITPNALDQARGGDAIADYWSAGGLVAGAALYHLGPWKAKAVKVAETVGAEALHVAEDAAKVAKFLPK